MCLNRNCNIPNHEEFTFFWSGPFSQWHPSPMEIDGVWYNCAEMYMMAEKARLFKDDETLAKIMSAVDPSDQKRYGREVKGFDKEKWDAVAKDIVYKGSMAKYTQNPDLKRDLLATVGTTLVEASPKDNIWGIGLAKTDSRALDRSTWRGKNWLGETLTKVRDDIISKKNTMVNTPDNPISVKQELIDVVEQKIKNLCSEADALEKMHMNLISKYNIPVNTPLSGSLSKYIKCLSKLSAISMIGDYENIEISMNRGLTIERKIGVMDPIGIKPSGKECAKILLYSGLDKYSDKIPNDEKFVN
jgi:ribA/ribD-fused uncharacterized protein